MTLTVARKAAGSCRFVSKKGTLGRARSCLSPVYLTAKGTRRWSLELRGTFPKGTYEVTVRARDGAGNREAAQKIALRLR